MTSWNGTLFRVAGPLWAEFTVHRWISLTKASDAELWYFLWCTPEQMFQQTIETPVIWDATALIVTLCNDTWCVLVRRIIVSLQWRHTECDGVSNHQRLHFYSTVASDADQRKHQSSASLAFVRVIHRGLVNSPHKRPVTRKMSPFDNVIMYTFG